MAAILLLALCFVGATPALAQGEASRIALKLRDGSDAWLEKGELVARRADLAPLRRALAERGVGRDALSPTFSRSRAEIRAERALGERRSGRRLPDLALFFNLELPPGTDPYAFAASLRALPLVESAEPWPTPVPPPFDIDPPTPDFSAMQTYTAAAPAGIGSEALASVSGADGAGTRFVDIEYDWRLDHEDLELPASALIPVGTPVDPFMDLGSHGSAVLGILSARSNGYGVTGLVPAAEARVAASNTDEHGWDIGHAIEQALLALSPAGPGDVILIEQQIYVCGYTGSGESQLGAGPVEWFSAWRAAIAIATAQGVLVVEPAGNGSVDLDDPNCAGVFQRANGDTGALIVAAGSASSHAPLSYASYGSRVDVQGIGESITTLGGGALFGGGDPVQRYQANFGGSSGGSAMVAGVVLALQGMRLASGQAPLDPVELRDLLVQTGTPQATDPRQIGPLPDLAAAYDVGVAPPQVTVLPASGALALAALLCAVVVLRQRLR